MLTQGMYSHRSSRATSSHCISGIASEIQPGNSISQVKDSNVQTWRMNVKHNDNSNWSLHHSDASVSKNDNVKYLPGLIVPKSYLKELSDSEKLKLSYHPSAARLINEVRKERYNNDCQWLARAIGWHVY